MLYMSFFPLWNAASLFYNRKCSACILWPFARRSAANIGQTSPLSSEISLIGIVDIFTFNRPAEKVFLCVLIFPVWCKSDKSWSTNVARRERFQSWKLKDDHSLCLMDLYFGELLHANVPCAKGSVYCSYLQKWITERSIRRGERWTVVLFSFHNSSQSWSTFTLMPCLMRHHLPLFNSFFPPFISAETLRICSLQI